LITPTRPLFPIATTFPTCFINGKGKIVDGLACFCPFKSQGSPKSAYFNLASCQCERHPEVSWANPFRPKQRKKRSQKKNILGLCSAVQRMDWILILNQFIYKDQAVNCCFIEFRLLKF